MNYIYTIDKINSNKTINDFLLDNNYSKTLISAIKYLGGQILVNDKEENVNYKLRENDLIYIKLPPEEVSDEINSFDFKLDIVYEDEYLIIINKEANLPTIPSIRHQNYTLTNALKHYYINNNIKANIHFINRLDKDTTGLVMVAKDRYVHHVFSNHVDFEKKYQAIVHGNINNDITIEKNIKREDDMNVKRIVDLDGQYAKTIVNVIKNYMDMCLVELVLCTGRTHQIRVHMSYINHPLLGDLLYGGNNLLIDRTALHSSYLRFIHPFTKQEHIIKQSLPQDMEKLLGV